MNTKPCVMVRESMRKMTMKTGFLPCFVFMLTRDFLAKLVKMFKCLVDWPWVLGFSNEWKWRWRWIRISGTGNSLHRFTYTGTATTTLDWTFNFWCSRRSCRRNWWVEVAEETSRSKLQKKLLGSKLLESKLVERKLVKEKGWLGLGGALVKGIGLGILQLKFLEEEEFVLVFLSSLEIFWPCLIAYILCHLSHFSLWFGSYLMKKTLLIIKWK